MNIKNKPFSPAAIAGLMLTAGSLHAATLQVDIQQDDGNGITQSGWNAWEITGTFASAARSTTFSYADTTGGTLGATLTPSSNAGARNYGLDNVTSGTLTNPNVWYDQYFFNQNTAGTLTLTLSNLKAGSYSFTSYHYADDLAFSNNDEGVASVFVDTGSGFSDTGSNVTFTSGLSGTPLASRNLSATQVMTDGTFTTTFTVANDGDAINIRYGTTSGLDSGDSFGINGFALIPEPSSLSLMGLSLGALLFRRRRK